MRVDDVAGKCTCPWAVVELELLAHADPLVGPQPLITSLASTGSSASSKEEEAARAYVYTGTLPYENTGTLRYGYTGTIRYRCTGTLRHGYTGTHALTVGERVLRPWPLVFTFSSSFGGAAFVRGFARQGGCMRGWASLENGKTFIPKSIPSELYHLCENGVTHPTGNASVSVSVGARALLAKSKVSVTVPVPAKLCEVERHGHALGRAVQVDPGLTALGFRA